MRNITFRTPKFFRLIFIASLFLLNITLSFAQVCGTPGADGPINVSTSINTYYPITGTLNLAKGEKTIALSAVAATDSHGNNFGGTQISSGDLVLIIQMQDAIIDYSNNPNYGSGSSTSGIDGLGGTGFTNLGNTGIYEYVIATSNVPLTGGTLTFIGTGTTGGALNDYFNAAPTTTRGKRTFQIIRVPQFSNLTLNSNITTPPFNGFAGGIIAFNVSGTFNFNGFNIDGSARGFRGGYSPVATTNANNSTTYVDDSTNSVVSGKGEGIAGTPRYMWDGFNQVNNGVEGMPGGSAGRGAPANAGGGGNDHNSGGGGGGNGGNGGLGGLGWQGGGGDVSPLNGGGRPGYTSYLTTTPLLTRLVMGGGGGAGDANNAVNGVKGGVGGAIILINAGSIQGSGNIYANGGVGAAGTYSGAPDGAGGGGAGGTVFLNISNNSTTTINIEAKGGNGGNTLNDENNSHGPGGGGGGGIIRYNVPGSGVTINTSVINGTSGVTADNKNHGAQPGTAGYVSTFSSSDMPSELQINSNCLSSLSTKVNSVNKSICNTIDATVIYEIEITNLGSGNAAQVNLNYLFPSGINFDSATVSYTLNASGPMGSLANTGTANSPIVGGFNIPLNGVVTITLVGKVADAMAPGTTYSSKAQALYLDPTRTIADPSRRITPFTNSFGTANTAYQTGGGLNVGGTNFDGTSKTEDDVIVLASPAAPSISASGPITFCTGGSVVLTSTVGTGYLWSTGATTQSITVSITGSYSVKVANATGCQSPASVATSVTVNSTPSAPSATAQTFCLVDNKLVSDLSPSGVGIKWYNASTGGTLYAGNETLTNGTYYVSKTTSGCESPRTSVSVTVTPKPADVITNKSICSGGSYSWPVNNNIYTTNQSALKIVNDGCTADQILNLTVTPKPTTVVTNKTICSGQNYIWAANGNTYTVANTYTINNDGCTADQILNLTVTPKPSAVVTNKTICSGESYTWVANNTVYNTNQSALKIVNDGCTADQILNLTVTPKPTTVVTNKTICSGENYIWSANGNTYTVASTYTINNNGCTSDQILNLTVTPKPSAVVTNKTICSGENYIWSANGNTYTVANTYTINNDGCTADQILNLTVTPKPSAVVTNKMICSGESYIWSANGNTYTVADTYTVNNDGCTADQILNLIVTPKPTTVVTNKTICSGENYIWSANGSTYNVANTYTINNDGCTADQILNLTVTPKPTTVVTNKTICSGQNYIWAANGNTYTVANTYTINNDGCTADQILNLTVTPKPSAVVTNKTICSGENYIWSANGSTYNVANTYTINNDGCTADQILNLTVTPKPTTVVTNKTICSGENYIWSANGNTYTVADTYTVNNDGCTADQILNLIVTPKPTTVVTNKTICSGENYIWSANGSTYTVANTYTVNNDGCTADQILNLTVTPKPSAVVTNKTICSGENYIWSANGSTYTVANTYTVNNDGCTADQILNLTVTPKPSAVVTNKTICSGENYIWSANGSTYTVADTYTINNDGCTADQILNLTVTPKPSAVVTNKTICSGESYTWAANNTVYNTNQSALKIVNDGCTADQILNLIVTPKPTTVVTNKTICSGENYIWSANGSTYNVANTYTINNDGCTADQILNLTVTPKPSAVVTNKTICSGESYIWAANGNTYTVANTYTINNDGCTADQILNLTVTPKPSAVVTNKTICSGENYIWSANGNTYTVANTYTINNDGCTADQILNLTVTPKPSAVVTNKTICSGENYIWSANGNTYTVADTYTVNNDGCTADQILNLTVTPKPSVVVTNKTICSGESYIWSANGNTYTVADTYTINNDGCTADQILNLTVTPKPSAVVTNKTICSGENYIWSANGNTYTVANTYTINNDGCTADQILNLTVTPKPSAVVTNKTICSGENYIWSANGNTYTVANTYTINNDGCTADQILNLTVTPKPSAVVTNKTICSGENYIWSANGNTYTVANTYTINNDGCTADQILNLTVSTIAKPIVNTINQPTCSSSVASVELSGLPTGTWTINPGNISGNTTTTTISGLLPGNTYNYTVTNSFGCESLASSDIIISDFICAEDDTPSSINGAIGGTISTVFVNDKINGLAFLPTDVSVSTTTLPAGLTFNSDGTIVIAPNTAVGTHIITYTICKSTNLAICDSATIAVIVTAPVIDAVPETTAPVNGSIGGTTTISLITNDTLNGSSAVIGTQAGQVKLTGLAVPTGLTLNADGTITVAAGTPIGNYEVEYSICEINNPINCDTAKSIIPVTGAVLVLKDDSASSVVGTNQPKTVLNVLDNDTKNGQPIVSTAVSISETVADPTGNIKLNLDGTIVLKANTPAGTYELTYQVCELNTTNCSIATVKVTVVAPTMTITANSYCSNNVPYVSYNVVPDNFTPNNLLTIRWIDSANNVVATQTNLPLSGNILWPGAVIDNNGNGLDWPGWLLTNGQWTEGADGFEKTKPSVTMEFSVNSTVNVVVNYPVATATCNAKPIFTIKANDDEAGPINTNKEISTALNIFKNDILNGVILNATNVVLTTVIPNPNLILNADGSIDLQPKTPSGTYQLTYQICDALNLSNCSQAIVRITVLNSANPEPPITPLIPIVLTNDTANVDGINGELEFINVLNNDLVKGLPINIADIVFTNTSTSSYFEFNSDGTVNVKPNTPGGNYALTYQVCEKANPTNCKTATLNVFVEVPSVAIIKTASFNDENRDGVAEAGETITYKFKITNTGNVALVQIKIADPLPGVVISGQAIDLGVNESNDTNFTAEYKITQNDINHGSVTNQASVQGRSAKGIIVSDTSDQESNADDRPTVLALNGCQIKVFNAFSPNGDSKNARFYIQGLECYPDNTVEIYNRWGVLVYNTDHYNNEDRVFVGVSQGRTTVKQSDGLPVGTYYYILKYRDSGSNQYELSGYLYINK
ncbi:gliding motility-associated C-terminal domain-containing protein [uncultured Flavobacterium sp.]|uniref:gliding motility-associated C-terminal domain-containing protein n=1 Tax=uncultured Flavobacterium sp. TaxID=165435 RepID=UPI002931586E|nr:gliding motility-associated C-terminal domain-containing protein [uncultured Flavobacterium sp.]